LIRAAGSGALFGAGRPAAPPVFAGCVLCESEDAELPSTAASTRPVLAPPSTLALHVNIAMQAAKITPETLPTDGAAHCRIT
jgi:hypothetical protein